MLLARNLSVSRSGVLDLASGSGAFLARIERLGFSELEAVELDREKFGLPGVAPMALDLNHDFSAALPRRYPLITAIEIIEHLDSPRHFLRSVHAALTDRGHLLVSTPNVAGWRGRVAFLLRGTLRQFDEAQYDYNHHISPIPPLQMLQMFRETGLEVVDQTCAGSFAGPLKRALGVPFAAAIQSVGGDGLIGDVNLYLVRRADTAPAVARPTDWVGRNGQTTRPPLASVS